MNTHCKQKSNINWTVPLLSQGEVVFQQGVENRVVSADLLLF